MRTALIEKTIEITDIEIEMMVELKTNKELNERLLEKLQEQGFSDMFYMMIPFWIGLSNGLRRSIDMEPHPRTNTFPDLIEQLMRGEEYV